MEKTGMPHDKVRVINLEKLNTVTNEMAFQIATIRTGMTGKGISPAKSALIENQLLDIEQKLQMLGADEKNPIPFDSIR